MKQINKPVPFAKFQNAKDLAKTTPETKFSTGLITAAVWKNSGKDKDGNVTEFRTVTLQKRYIDAKNEWHDSNSFSASDLPKLRLVVDKAYEYLTLKDNPVSMQQEIDI